MIIPVIPGETDSETTAKRPTELAVTCGNLRLKKLPRKKRTRRQGYGRQEESKKGRPLPFAANSARFGLQK
jgi:hypothetical protein